MRMSEFLKLVSQNQRWVLYISCTRGILVIKI